MCVFTVFIPHHETKKYSYLDVRIDNLFVHDRDGFIRGSTIAVTVVAFPFRVLAAGGAGGGDGRCM